MSVEAGHAGPSLPWETILEQYDSPPTVSDVVDELKGEDDTRADIHALLNQAAIGGEIEIEAGQVRAVSSRLTNLHNSVNGDFGRLSGSDDPEGDKLPEPARQGLERFEDAYPDRAAMPLTQVHGQPIRRDYTDETYLEWESDARIWECACGATIPRRLKEDHVRKSHAGLVEDLAEDYAGDPVRRAVDIQSVPVKPATGRQVIDRKPFTWGEGLRELLKSHAKTKATSINLQRPEPRKATHTIQAENRWMESAQRTYFAQMKAWLRELCGGERPSGGETSGAFEDPTIAFLTRSASGVPDGERLAPVDHMVSIRDSWEPCYHQLRNTLRSMGFEMGEDWQYVRVLEPHTTKRAGEDYGTNACYAHEHIVLVIDGEVTAEDLRPVIDKHVEKCEYAGADAHKEGSIEISDPDEIDNLAAYVADYASVKPVDLFERAPEYLGFAATVAATNTRTITRSDTAIMAANADACKQQYESGESVQSENHGEDVRLSDRRGYKLECAACGSPHGIEQKTLTAHRLAVDERPDLVPDDADPDAPEDPQAHRVAELRARAPECQRAATVGISPSERAERDAIKAYLKGNQDATVPEIQGALADVLPPPAESERLIAEVRSGVDHTQVVGFERPPEWRVVSVTIDGETYRTSGGNGIEMAPVMYPHRGLQAALDVEEKGLYRCKCGAALRGRSLTGHLASVHGKTEPEVADRFFERHENDTRDLSIDCKDGPEKDNKSSDIKENNPEQSFDSGSVSIPPWEKFDRVRIGKTPRWAACR